MRWLCCFSLVSSEPMLLVPKPRLPGSILWEEGAKNWRSLMSEFWPGLFVAPTNSAPSANYRLLILLRSGQMTKWGETQNKQPSE